MSQAIPLLNATLSLQPSTFRLDNAYILPSLVFLGLALHDLASSFFVLLGKFSTAKTTSLYIWSVFVWVTLCGYITTYLLLADYIGSPPMQGIVSFVVPKPGAPKVTLTLPAAMDTQYLGYLLLSAYSFNILVGVGIVIVALVRLQLFFGKTTTYLVMLLIGILTTIARLGAMAIGILMALDMLQDPTKLAALGVEPENSKYELQMLLAFVNQGLEAIFFFSTSVLFFMAIGRGLGKSRSELSYEVMVHHEGARLITIMVMNIICASCAGYVYFAKGRHTIFSHSGLYMPAWIYALAFYTFLSTSYITAKTMIQSAKNNSGSSKLQLNSKQTPPAKDDDLPAIFSKQSYKESYNFSDVSSYNQWDDKKMPQMPPQNQMPTQQPQYQQHHVQQNQFQPYQSYNIHEQAPSPTPNKKTVGYRTVYSPTRFDS